MQKSLSCGFRRVAFLLALGVSLLCTGCGGGGGEPFSYPAAALDTGFGNGGVVEISNPRTLGTAVTSFTVTTMAVDKEGRLLVGGFRWQDERQAFVVRLLADGTLDSSCGVGGWALWTTGGPATLRGMTVLRDGRIAVVGRLPMSQVTVLNGTDCSVDQSFGSAGSVWFDEILDVSPMPEPSTIVQDPASGNLAIPSAGKLLLLNEHGGRVASFGSNGVVSLSSPLGGTFVAGGAAFVDGGLVLGGATDFGLVDGAYPGFLKLRMDGSIDQTFGSGGSSQQRVGTNRLAYVWGFAALPNGNFMLTGQTQPDVGSAGLANTDAFFMMVNAAGQPTGFGGSGLATWDAGNKAGSSSNYNYGLLVDGKKRAVSCAYFLNNTGAYSGSVATEEDSLQFRDAETGLPAGVGVDGTLSLPTNCLAMANASDGDVYSLGVGTVTIDAASFVISKAKLP